MGLNPVATAQARGGATPAAPLRSDSESLRQTGLKSPCKLTDVFEIARKVKIIA